ncbi:MAG: choice-of-anchor Q domain-containing protein [Terriglobales bacterium]
MKRLHRTRPARMLVITLCTVLAVQAGMLTVVRAATFNPPDVPTLIANIATANGNGQDNTINLTAGATYTLTSVNNGAAGDENGLPVITSSGHTLTINGNGATLTRGSGAPNFRFFTVNSGATLTLNQVNVSNGNLVAPNGLDGPNRANGADVFGGAIRNNGTTNITGGTFSGNSVIGGNGNSGGGSGGAGNGGAIHNDGTLSITGATLANNRATGGNGGGGGNFVPGDGGIANGGAISTTDTLTVAGATLSSNRATGGNGFNYIPTVHGGALYDTGASVTISGTTFSQNSVLSGVFLPGTDRTGGARGGAIYSYGIPQNQFSITGSSIAQNTTSAIFAEGGGIFYGTGTLTLTNTTVQDNTVAYAPSATNLNVNSNGGGIFATGVMTLMNSTVNANHVTATTPNTGSSASGGGIYGGGRLINSTVTNNSVTVTAKALFGNSADGGGIYTLAGLTMTNSTVSNNTVTNASSISGGGSAFANGGGVVNGCGTGSIITGSTMSGNTLTAPTGTTGGGIYDNNGCLTITNSTISGNTALTGGGAYEKSGQMAFVNSTVASNSSGVNADPFATISLKNTLLANTSLDCVGATSNYFSADYNLAKDHTCDASLTGAHDQKGVDPTLDTLKVNAPGTTATHALLPGSPAIDTIPNTGGCNNAGVATDQRGVARPQPAGGLCDIGAFEVQATIPAPTVTGISPTSGPTTGGSAVTITGTGFQSGVTVTFGGASGTVTSVTPTQIVVTTPVHIAGVVSVQVTNPDGGTISQPNAYTYGVLNPLPSPQPTAPVVVNTPAPLPVVRPTGVPITNPTPLPLPTRRP